MIFSSMSSRLLYHLGENLVPVREAGDHVYVFTAVRLQLRRRGGDVRLTVTFSRGMSVKENRSARSLQYRAGEDDPPHLGGVQLVEVDVPQPAGLAGEVFRLTASTITRTVQGSWAARM